MIYSNISYLTHFIQNVLHHIYTMHTPHTHKMTKMDIFSSFFLDVRVYFIYTTYFILISKVSSKMCVCESYFVANYTLINDSKGLWEKNVIDNGKSIFQIVVRIQLSDTLCLWSCEFFNWWFIGIFLEFQCDTMSMRPNNVSANHAPISKWPINGLHIFFSLDIAQKEVTIENI